VQSSIKGTAPPPGAMRREGMMTVIVYVGIVLLSIYVAVIGHGYVVALAFIVGGIAFFSLQLHFHKCYSEVVKSDEVDSDSGDHDDHLGLPPA